MSTPTTLEGYAVVIRFAVTWGDMDAFAHLNNVVYFRYFESARIAYFERAGVVAHGGQPEGVGPILHSTSCRFRAPITYPDTVQVGARVRALADDRFTMEYAVHSEQLQRLAASGEGLVVAFDYRTAQKARLPEAWRRAIRALDGLE